MGDVTDQAVMASGALKLATFEAEAVMVRQARALVAARADVAWHEGQSAEHLRRKKHAQLVTAEMAGTVRLVRAAVEAWQLGALSAEDALEEINDLVEKP